MRRRQLSTRQIRRRTVMTIHSLTSVPHDGEVGVAQVGREGHERLYRELVLAWCPVPGSGVAA